MRTTHEIAARLAANREALREVGRTLATLERWLERSATERRDLLDALAARLERRRALQDEIDMLSWILEDDEDPRPLPARSRPPGLGAS